MATRQSRGVILEDHVSPQKHSGSNYVCIPKRMLRSAGIDPSDGDFTDEIPIQYHKGGDRDGEVVIDLKEVSDE